MLLLDEPLGALDAKIRKQLRVELKALQEEVGITFMFVTHDQEEALSMSDRVAVMNDGRIEQVGHARPRSTRSPATVFVADFLGVSNLMDADAGRAAGTGDCTVRVGDFALRARCGDVDGLRAGARSSPGPSAWSCSSTGAERDNCLPGMVERTVYVGASLQVMVRLPTGAQLQASIANTGDADGYTQGTPVSRAHPGRRAARAVGHSGVPPRRASRPSDGVPAALVPRLAAMSVSDLLEGKRVCVCGGSGGVGKTTTSAAIALGMAAEGAKVAVVTIDPAKRLANALGPAGARERAAAGRARAAGRRRRWRFRASCGR